MTTVSNILFFIYNFFLNGYGYTKAVFLYYDDLFPFLIDIFGFLDNIVDTIIIFFMVILFISLITYCRNYLFQILNNVFIKNTYFFKNILILQNYFFSFFLYFKRSILTLINKLYYFFKNK